MNIKKVLEETYNNLLESIDHYGEYLETIYGNPRTDYYYGKLEGKIEIIEELLSELED